MVITRYTQLNVDLIRNLPSDMKAELIIFEEVIPDGIMTSICANDPFYNKERMDFLNHREDLLEKIYYARGKREELAKKDDAAEESMVSARINVSTDEKVQFIKDYPKFKDLIESIIYEDENGDVIKVVPIDEYLANN